VASYEFSQLFVFALAIENVYTPSHSVDTWRSGEVTVVHVSPVTGPCMCALQYDAFYRVKRNVCTGWPQKLAHFVLYALTSSNIDRFANLFHYQNQEKIVNNILTKDLAKPQVSR